MAERQALKDAELAFVSGGVTIDNNWGDFSIFKIGKNNGPFTHTFKAEDFDTVADIVRATYTPGLSEQANDNNIMAALIAAPGLLTPL